MFGNGVFGSKMVDMTTGWRKLHNKGLHELFNCYQYGYQLEEEMGHRCSTHGIDWVSMPILFEKTVRKKPLERYLGLRESNIKMNLAQMS